MTFPDTIRQADENGQGTESEKIPNIDYYAIKKAALILRAVNHKLRQQIIQTIFESSNLTVTDLYVKLRLEQSVASQHLAILRKAGIVTTQREGKYIYYSLNFTRLEQINEFSKNLAG